MSDSFHDPFLDDILAGLNALEDMQEVAPEQGGLFSSLGGVQMQQKRANER